MLPPFADLVLGDRDPRRGKRESLVRLYCRVWMGVNRTSDDPRQPEDPRLPLRAGNADAIARAVRLIALVVNDRGYAIPLAELR